MNPTTMTVSYSEITNRLAYVAQRRRDLYMVSAYDYSAALIKDILKEAREFDIHLSDFDEVFDLPSAALDIMANYFRKGIPPTEDGILELTDTAAKRLRDIDPQSTQDGPVISLPRNPNTPAWGPSGAARLAITLDPQSGWNLLLLEDDVSVGQPVNVVAPYEWDDAEMIANIAHEINTGKTRNPFA